MILLAAPSKPSLHFWRPRQGVDGAWSTGIGPVEASCALAAALAQRPYGLVVNAGIAGTFDGAAHIGDGVVVADDTIELALESGAPLALPEGSSVVDRARFRSPHSSLGLRARGFAALRGITVSHVTVDRSDRAPPRTRARRAGRVDGGFCRAARRAARRRSRDRGSRDFESLRRPRTSGWDFAAGVTGASRVDALFETSLFEVPR